ncbi:MAG TPA: hypothetical protein VGI45_34660 [Terracidiphilus sp.]|jgi:hypothetical protein
MDVAATLDPITDSATGQLWGTGKRLGFRFCFVYFTLFCLSSQIINTLLVIPKIDVPDWDTLWPARSIIFWVGAHIFGVKLPMVYSGSGSGDKVYDWVTMFCIFVVAVAATVIWSLLDRNRQNYGTLYAWFWLFIRFCLAGQMIVYGFAKAVPLQMPRPFLFTLTEPFGNFSPMGVLWSSIGASQAYEIFAGCAELTGGILLMFPTTAALGALVALADLVEIFLLNMTYDVPVKLLSLHLILMSLFLLGPNLQRLANFFLLERPTAPATPVNLPLASARALRIAAIAQVVLWLWVVGNNIYGDRDAWHQYGPGRPKPLLYGIWDLNQITVDGQVRPPLMTDSDRWRRIIFDFPGEAQIQQMDDSRKGYGADIDEKKSTVSMTRPDDKNWKASLTYTRPSADQLQLDGTWGGHKVQIQLKREDETKFPLNSRGFHWVQDYPFNR